MTGKLLHSNYRKFMKSSKQIIHSTGNGIATLLVFILILRIISYFMLSDSVFITQLIKVSLRFLVSGLLVIILLQQQSKAKQLLTFTNPLPVLFYLGYLFLGLCSLLWTSSFRDSTLQLMMDVEGLVFAFLFIKAWMINNAGSGLRLGKLLAVSIGIIMSVFLIGMIIDPAQFYRMTHGGEEARLGGFIINPNELGMLIGVGIGATITDWKFAKRKIFYAVAMLMFLYALVLTGSRSSMIALMLIVFFFIMQTKDLRIRIAVILSVLVAIPFVIKSVIIKQGNVDEVMNMTGRIPFWKDLLSINFPREPVLGYGYMRIDYTDKFESINAYAGAMTHNTFLQALMGLGLVGLTIVLAQLALTVHAIFKTTHVYKRRLAIAILIPLLINSFTEFGIFGETNYGIMFYLMLVFMVCMEPSEQKLRTSVSVTSNAHTSLLPERSSAPAPVILQ